MTTTTLPEESQASLEPVSHAPQGLLGKYVFSFDHKVIGIQYLITAMVMAIFASFLAVIIRMQLASPENKIILPETYLSVVTIHGTIMVFFVISLGLVSGLGNLLIPLCVGARDMAYPFLNMLSYWTIVPACLLILASFLVEGGAAAAGWTSYPPLSALAEAVPGSGLGQTLWLLAMALFIASFTMGGLNYLTTILNMRARGMSMMRMPLVVWTFLIATVLGLLAFPALTAAAIMLLFDRHGGTSFFLSSGMIFGDEVLANEGGTPLLFQHLFWFLGHPEVYVLVLPAIGVAFDIIATYTRRPLFGYRLSVYSLLVIAFLSMIVWGHHMFVTGMNPYVGEYFSIATVLITLPFTVLGLNLIASHWRARMRLTTAMLFALGTVSAVGTGGLGGLYLGTAAADIFFHETYFVVGHFHFMIGTVTFLALFGAIYHWFPKMFGRMLNEKLGKLHFWLTIVPMFTMFILMHFQGLGGSLRRTYTQIYDFSEGGAALHPWISGVAYVVVGAQILFFVNFFFSAFAGGRVGDNPWRSTTLEWSTSSPPPHGNWEGDLPVVERDPYEYGEGGTEGDFSPQAAAQGAS